MVAGADPARAWVGAAAGPGCEPVGDGVLAEPVSAVTSLVFVLAGLVVLFAARRDGGAAVARVRGYAVLVAAVGAGSFVQHGPDPALSDVAHDLPLLATLAFVAADAAADLTGRRRAWWWWALPTVALLPLVALAPRPGDLAQVAVASVAVTLTVLRAAARPAVRRRIAVALGLLVAGATLGTLSRAGGVLCDPASLWQGHGGWHVLASAALVVLAPVVGTAPVGMHGGVVAPTLGRSRATGPVRPPGEEHRRPRERPCP